MAGLTGKTIAATYESLLKVSTTDNANLVADTQKDIVDGLDNVSALKLATNRATITLGTNANDDFIVTDGSSNILTVEGDTKDVTLLDDLIFISDSSVVKFGADGDTTLTHTDGTGLTLNSTNKLCFGDTGTYIHQSANGVLDLVSDTEMELNATTIDINATTIDLSTQNVAVSLNSDTNALNIDSNTFVIDAANNIVGIGTATPDVALEIERTSTQLKLSYDGSNYASFDVAADGLLTITTADDAEADIILSPAGNVGIGTTSPGVILDINADGDDDYITSVAKFQAHTGVSYGTRFEILAGRDDNLETYRYTVIQSSLTGTSTVRKPMMINGYGGKVGIGNVVANAACHVGSATAISSGGGISLLVTGTGGAGDEAEAALGVFYSTASETNSACGYIKLEQADGNPVYLWCNNSNILRGSTTESHIGKATDGVAFSTDLAASDERLKNISSDPFPYGLTDINKLNPIQFTFKKDPDSQNTLGFSAQATQPILPETVQDSGICIHGYTYEKGEDGSDTSTPKGNPDETKLVMQYHQIIPVLVKAVQELSATVDILSTKVTALENA